MDNLTKCVGKFMNLETIDGIPRKGKITAMVFRDIKFNDQHVSVPSEIQVNGDPHDLIEIGRIQNLNIQPDINEE
jgi:hypothetical protein